MTSSYGDAASDVRHEIVDLLFLGLPPPVSFLSSLVFKMINNLYYSSFSMCSFLHIAVPEPLADSKRQRNLYNRQK